ncbi:MAG TPA: cytochrome c oxidase assembly protein, partial [Rhodospirillaceae bacterium]|nr:cytochrome c oxidase assembly protein [Rhodospirillaceae bacterium]
MNRISDSDLIRKNRRTGLIVLLAVAGLVGLAYASVPLYRLFCQVTGFGGTTQRAAADDAAP